MVDPFDLTNRVAVITGASRGIGEAIARLLSKKGAHVLITSRDKESCLLIAESIENDGGSAEAFACHVGKTEHIAKLFQYIDTAHGRIDILINNASINPYFGSILDTPPEALEKTLQVNIQGSFSMSVEAGKRMRMQGGGSIVNVASINAIKPGEKQAAYSITKAAIVNMTLAFARECGQFGIRVNAILPGLTDTKFSSVLIEDDQVLESWLQKVPLKRIATPEEMAAAALYFASDASSYTTGSCLVIDGGALIT